MSDQSRLVVTSVSMRRDQAVFEFEDGHKAVFDPYSHGFGYQIEGLSHFFLYNGEEQVVQYDSRLYRSGPTDDEHKFVQVADGYPIERIVEYWMAAKEHINNKYNEAREEGEEAAGKLWLAWMVGTQGWIDLRMIEKGQISLPEPVSS